MVLKAVREIALMEEPSLTEYSKPLTLSDRSDYVPLRHDDYNFVIGFTTMVHPRAKRRQAGDNTILDSIPPEVGAWYVKFEEEFENRQERVEA